MNRGNHVQELASITDELLTVDHLGRLSEAGQRLHTLFCGISAVDTAEDRRNERETYLPTGKAISPRDAARCIIDFARTAQFLRGIHAAIAEALKRFPNEQIQVLYAGCGPFATLVTPLAARFRPEQIKFTLLDIHERSLESSEQIMEAFGLSAYVQDYVETDATTYTHPTRPHLIILETMQRALDKEPQLPIMLNLAPQLRDDGILVPEQICVDACLVNPRNEFESLPKIQEWDSTSEPVVELVRVNLGCLLELTAQKLPLVFEGARLQVSTITIPEEVEEDLQVMLRTKLKIFGTAALADYDSGITTPLLLQNFGIARAGRKIEFVYCLDGEPGFMWRSEDSDWKYASSRPTARVGVGC